MKIGIPAETKPGERRVAVIPRDVLSLTRRGHEVNVQSGAGSGAGYPDDEFRECGALVVEASRARDSELVVKVKELQEMDHAHVVPGCTVFGYHHLTGHPAHARRLFASGITAIAFEAARDGNGGFPLLAPMSVIAGRLSVQVAALALGHAPRDVLVLGAGHAGNAAAAAAHTAGARVTQLRHATADPHAVEHAALQADLVVGAVFSAGERTPQLLPRSLVARMKNGSMIVDLSIEEGGIAETSRATSHANPTYVEEGVIHYAVPNIPSAVPRDASASISAAATSYLQALAGKGIARAMLDDAGLRAGVLAWNGRCSHASIADEAGVPYAPVSDLELREAAA